MKNLLVIFVVVLSLEFDFTTGVSFRNKVFCEENGVFPEGRLECSSKELINVDQLKFYSGTTCTSDDRFQCGRTLYNSNDGISPNCTTKGSCTITLPSKPSGCRDQVSIYIDYRCVEDKVHDVCESIQTSSSDTRLFFSTPGYPGLSPFDSPGFCRCDIKPKFVTSVSIIDLMFSADTQVLVMNGDSTVFNKTSASSPLRVYNERKALEFSISLRIIVNQQQASGAKLWIEVEGISMNATCGPAEAWTTTVSTSSPETTTTSSLPSTSTTFSSSTSSSMSTSSPETTTASSRPSTSTTFSSSTTSPMSASISSTVLTTLFSSYKPSTSSNPSSTSPSSLPTDTTKHSSTTSSTSKPISTSEASSSSSTSSSTSYSSSSSSTTSSSSKSTSISSPSTTISSPSTTSSSPSKSTTTRPSTISPQSTTPALDNRDISYNARQVCEKDDKFPVLDITCRGDSKINIETITYYSGSSCTSDNRAQCGVTLTNSSNGLAHDCNNRTFCGVYIPNKPRDCSGVVSATVNYRCISGTLHNICGSTTIVNTTNRLFLSTPGYPELSPFNKEAQCSCSIRGSRIAGVSLVDLVLEKSTVNIADGTGRYIYQEGDMNARKRLYNVKIPFTSATSTLITFQHRENSYQKLWIEVHGMNMVSECRSENITPVSILPTTPTSPFPLTNPTTGDPGSSRKSSSEAVPTPSSRPTSISQGTTTAASSLTVKPTNGGQSTLSTQPSVTTKAPATSISTPLTSSIMDDSASSATSSPTQSQGQLTSLNTAVPTKSSGSSSLSTTTLSSTKSGGLASSTRSTPQSSLSTDATHSNNLSSETSTASISVSSKTITPQQGGSTTTKQDPSSTTITDLLSSTKTPVGPTNPSSSTQTTRTDTQKSTSRSTTTTGVPTTKSPSSSPATTISIGETTKVGVVSTSITSGTSKSSQQFQTTLIPTERPTSTTTQKNTPNPTAVPSSSGLSTQTQQTPITSTSGVTSQTKQSPITTESTQATVRTSEQTSSKITTATNRVPDPQTSPGYNASVNPIPASSVRPGFGSSVSPGLAFSSSSSTGDSTSMDSVTDASGKPEDQSQANPNQSQASPTRANTTTLAIVGSIAGFFLLMFLLIAIFFYKRRKNKNETPIVGDDTQSEAETTSFEVPYSALNGSQYSRGSDNGNLTQGDEQTEVKQTPKPLKSILKKSPSNSANPSPSNTPGVLSLDEESGYSTVFFTPQSAVIPSLDVSPKSLVPKSRDRAPSYTEDDYATVNRAAMIKNRQPTEGSEEPPGSSSGPTGSYEITTHKPGSLPEEAKKPTSIRLPSRSSRYGEGNLTIYY